MVLPDLHSTRGGRTPYILTPDQAEAITLRCQRCEAVFLSNFKVKLEVDKSSYLCERCLTAEAFSRLDEAVGPSRRITRTGRRC